MAEPLTNERGEKTRVPRENPWRRASVDNTFLLSSGQGTIGCLWELSNTRKAGGGGGGKGGANTYPHIPIARQIHRHTDTQRQTHIHPKTQAHIHPCIYPLSFTNTNTLFNKHVHAPPSPPQYAHTDAYLMDKHKHIRNRQTQTHT